MDEINDESVRFKSKRNVLLDSFWPTMLDKDNNELGCTRRLVKSTDKFSDKFLFLQRTISFGMDLSLGQVLALGNQIRLLAFKKSLTLIVYNTMASKTKRRWP